MKSRYKEKQLEQTCQLRAVVVCSAAYLSAMNDIGLAPSTLRKVCKKAEVYAEQLNRRELNLKEICLQLLEETGIALTGIEL